MNLHKKMSPEDLHLGVGFQNRGIFPPKMDGENKGKPYFQMG